MHEEEPSSWLLYWGFGGRVDTNPLEKTVIWWGFVTQPIIGWIMSLLTDSARGDREMIRIMSLKPLYPKILNPTE